MHFKMSSAVYFNLDQSKILLSCNRLIPLGNNSPPILGITREYIAKTNSAYFLVRKTVYRNENTNKRSKITFE